MWQIADADKKAFFGLVTRKQSKMRGASTGH